VLEDAYKLEEFVISCFTRYLLEGGCVKEGGRMSQFGGKSRWEFEEEQGGWGGSFIP